LIFRDVARLLWARRATADSVGVKELNLGVAVGCDKAIAADAFGYRKKGGQSKNLINRDVAQMVARLLWEHAGGFRFLIFQTLENPCKH